MDRESGEPKSVELLSDDELRGEIIKLAGRYLGGKNHALVGTESERYLHLFARESGIRLSVEFPSLDETETYETDDIIVEPRIAVGSLDIVPTEELDPVTRDREDAHDALARERARTEAAREMGFANRELSRGELERIYIDLLTGELEGRSDR